MTIDGLAAGSSPDHVTSSVLLVVGPPGGGHEAIGDWLRASGLPVAADAAFAVTFAAVRDEAWRSRRATPTAPPELEASGRTADGGGRWAVEDPPMVVIDPSSALVLAPLSRAVPNLAVVVAWRSPEATVAALASEGVAPAHAVALWEAHLLGALDGAAGRPLVGLDLDDEAAARAHLGVFLRSLGIEARTGPAFDAGDHSPRSMAGAHDDAELAAFVGAAQTRLGSMLAAAVGAHLAWDPPEGLALGPTSEAILAAHRAAHRAAIDATAAWSTAHEAEVSAQDAKAAVEREHRELVGPDPAHYAELRRELWRLRDDLAGAIAGRVHFRTEWMRADAARLAAEARVNDVLTRLEQQQAHIDHLQAEREEILQSERWRIGGAVLSPFARLRRWLVRR